MLEAKSDDDPYDKNLLNIKYGNLTGYSETEKHV